MDENEKDFWEKFKKWQIDDIQIAINCKSYVSAAKLICCAIDSIAGFRFGANSNHGSKFRFTNFVKEFMPSFKTRLKCTKPRVKDGLVVWETQYKRSVIEMFYNNFRSGLIHEGLPGIGTEIVFYHNTKVLFSSPNADLVRFNILGLFEYLKNALEVYEKRLVIEKELQNNFKKRLSFITDANKISIIK